MGELEFGASICYVSVMLVQVQFGRIGDTCGCGRRIDGWKKQEGKMDGRPRKLILTCAGP